MAACLWWPVGFIDQAARTPLGVQPTPFPAFYARRRLDDMGSKFIKMLERAFSFWILGHSLGLCLLIELFLGGCIMVFRVQATWVASVASDEFWESSGYGKSNGCGEAVEAAVNMVHQFNHLEFFSSVSFIQCVAWIVWFASSLKITPIFPMGSSFMAALYKVLKQVLFHIGFFSGEKSNTDFAQLSIKLNDKLGKWYNCSLLFSALIKTISKQRRKSTHLKGRSGSVRL